jgi:hypothetical protein
MADSSQTFSRRRQVVQVMKNRGAVI